jgi:hypothetical protein
MLGAKLFHVLCVAGLGAVCMSCATLPIEGQFFSTRLEERDPHHTILMRWTDRYWRL